MSRTADAEDPAHVTLAPGLIRLRAPNPSPMTERGTNTYLLGRSEITVIDPGPARASSTEEPDPHIEAILAHVPPGARITRILVTHAHLDHSGAAGALAQRTGAPVHGFGPPHAGRSPAMQALADQGYQGGGEGIDHGFSPDVTLPHGAELMIDGAPLMALHTPGHFCNHMAFAWNGIVFTGDVIMGWTSTLISPPDGDVGAYLRSLALIEALAPVTLLPGHGDPVEEPRALIEALRARRLSRGADILRLLETEGPLRADQLTCRAYPDLPTHLHPAALRNTTAHLLDFMEQDLIFADRPLSPETIFGRCENTVEKST